MKSLICSPEQTEVPPAGSRGGRGVGHIMTIGVLAVMAGVLIGVKRR